MTVSCCALVTIMLAMSTSAESLGDVVNELVVVVVVVDELVVLAAVVVVSSTVEVSKVDDGLVVLSVVVHVGGSVIAIERLSSSVSSARKVARSTNATVKSA